MKYASILELTNVEELSSIDLNNVFGGDTDPIIIDNGSTGIISLWMDTGIRN